MGMRKHTNPSHDEYQATGRTKQAFKDQCDINKILKKAQIKGGLSHVQKYPEAVYGEFSQDTDLLTARNRIARAEQIFGELPAEARREFQNDALRFVSWAGDPANAGRLVELLPQIAEPGNYFPNPVRRGGQGAAAATAPTGSQEPSNVSSGAPPASAPDGDPAPS